MGQHAGSGMLLVLAVTWLLLGTRPALLTTLAVPFALAGVFIALQTTDPSLNLSVLLGVVIVLGMLVDDAVVVIEAIGQHLRRGLAPLEAAVSALREICLPVATPSLTTVASFLPLMLVGGYLGTMMGAGVVAEPGASLVDIAGPCGGDGQRRQWRAMAGTDAAGFATVLWTRLDSSSPRSTKILAGAAGGICVGGNRAGFGLGAFYAVT